MNSDDATPADLQLLQKLYQAMNLAVNALACDPDVFEVWAADQREISAARRLEAAAEEERE